MTLFGRRTPPDKVTLESFPTKKDSQMTAINIDSMNAFLQAGPKCFARVCNANTVFAVVSDDYVYPACGDHLSTAVREVAYQYSPPISSVTVFWKP